MKVIKGTMSTQQLKPKLGLDINYPMCIEKLQNKIVHRTLLATVGNTKDPGMLQVLQQESVLRG